MRDTGRLLPRCEEVTRILTRIQTVAEIGIRTPTQTAAGTGIRMRAKTEAGTGTRMRPRTAEEIGTEATRTVRRTGPRCRGRTRAQAGPIGRLRNHNGIRDPRRKKSIGGKDFSSYRVIGAGAIPPLQFFPAGNQQPLLISVDRNRVLPPPADSLSQETVYDHADQ